jgi:DNA invertase Pin-like site-specific DNA recombinase
VLDLGGESVDTKCATGKLILTIFVGEFEREMMLERQREGIAKVVAVCTGLLKRPE